MKGGRSHLGTAAVWMACLAPACASTDVTLAILPQQEAGTGAEASVPLDGASPFFDAGAPFDASEPFDASPPFDGSPPFATCRRSTDCSGDSYCGKASCSASSSGTCQFFPVQCSGDENPVCGCDGITYFNDCWRQAAGIAFSSQGPCRPGGASTCGAGADAGCPDGAVCAQLLGSAPATCSTNAQEICWVLPPQCPSADVIPPDLNLWDSCLPGDLHCVNTCMALRHGGLYTRSSTCHARDD
jgi:hypothetical protein